MGKINKRKNTFHSFVINPSYSLHRKKGSPTLSSVNVREESQIWAAIQAIANKAAKLTIQPNHPSIVWNSLAPNYVLMVSAER